MYIYTYGRGRNELKYYQDINTLIEDNFPMHDSCFLDYCDGHNTIEALFNEYGDSDITVKELFEEMYEEFVNEIKSCPDNYNIEIHETED